MYLCICYHKAPNRQINTSVFFVSKPTLSKYQPGTNYHWHKLNQNRSSLVALTGHAHPVGLLHVLEAVHDLALHDEVDAYPVLDTLLYYEHLEVGDRFRLQEVGQVIHCYLFFLLGVYVYMLDVAWLGRLGLWNWL